MWRLTVFLIVCLCARQAFAELPQAIGQALLQARIPESSVGLVIQSLDNDLPEISHGAEQPFNPASTIKLLTTLAALDSLGPARLWTTRVLVDGEVGAGILHGDLILQGGGDPSLTQERLWALLREVRARGIHEIHGDVVLDNSFYAIEAIDPAEFDQAPLKTYNARPAALLVNYNAVSLRLAPEADGLTARLDPPGLPLDLTTRLDRNAACNDWQESLEVARDGDTLRVGGVFPEACGERGLWLNLMCPAATVSNQFKTLWRELGGIHTGQMRLGRTPASARVWLEHESIPLSQIVRDINKYSNNVMAKMLFLNLGAARHGAPATWEKGQAALQAWLVEKGMSFPELVLENGSGLSRIERIAPISMARLLAWAARQPLYYEFAASLPALGLEGTQKRRLNETPLAGRAWLKTGTLNGVRALAGYFIAADGKRKLLALFINHGNAGQSTQAQHAIVEWALSGGARQESALPSHSAR